MIDATTELALIRQRRKLCRRRKYIKSALELHRAELVELRRHGGTLAEIQLWLRLHHRLHVATSTICRYFQKLPELNGGDNGAI